jgi:hypothetical protein
MVGTGAVIATARYIPVAMMLAEEIDIYADGVDDPEPISELLDASIGHLSQFHRTFGYHGDGISRRTAMMPSDWRTRAISTRPRTDLPPRFAQVQMISPWRNSVRGGRRSRHGYATRCALALSRRIVPQHCSKPNYLRERLSPKSSPVDGSLVSGVVSSRKPASTLRSGSEGPNSPGLIFIFAWCTERWARRKRKLHERVARTSRISPTPPATFGIARS